MTTRIKLRRDLAANWTQENPVLAAGEPGLETDTSKVKYGNGTTPWNSLDYSGAGAASLTDEGNVVITAGSTEHWIATQRKEQGSTTPSALRYDSQGNLYSLTRTFDDAANYDVTVITKYTATGNIAWQKTFSDAVSMALAVDSSDRAYITLGADAPVVTVIKFSTTGDILWQKDYNIGPIPAYGAYIEEKSTTTLALAIMIAEGGSEPTNILVLEISAANGSVLLKKSLQEPGDVIVVVTGIDVDSDENVFITGWYEDSGVGKMFIEKLDEDLEPVWTKSLEAPDNYDMYGGDCASDALGNIYVVGAFEVETTNSDIDFDQDKSAGILTKLNSLGVVMWTRRLGPGPCGSWIAGLTATATGDVYLSSLTFAKKTGVLPSDVSEGERENLGQNKMIVVRYDSQGEVVWQRYVDVANLQEEEPDGPEFVRGQAIAVFDDKFAVDGLGYSWNTTPFESGSTADNEYDYFVTQLPTEGTTLTIGGLHFTESRVPARFVTHTTSDSPLTHANWDETITAETSTLVADTDVKIANSLVQSETYQYTFGADGTLTIPNDGDLKLTQTQVGWLFALDARDGGDSIEGDCIAVDSQGNSYIAGEDQYNGRTFVMKVSPEGDRLWSMNIDETDDGDDGYTTSLKIHPVTGNIMVLGGIWDTYSYGVLYTIDQDTGRLLNVTEFKDSDADVELNTIAYTNTGDYVIGGNKNGEFSDEFPVVPQTGSGTGTIVILRSAVPVDNISTSWQIGGTGITPFQSIEYIERYQNLTGTVRQGLNATFDIINEGDGTYTVAVASGGTDYLAGHKIKILGTDLPGPENLEGFGFGEAFGFGEYKVFGDGTTSYFALASDLTDPVDTKTLLTSGDTITIDENGIGTQTTTITGSYGAISGTSYYGWALTTNIGGAGIDANINAFTIGNGIFSGATPDNDIIITVGSSNGGAINGVTHTGTAAGSSIQNANGVSGTNYEVGSGLVFTFEGPRDTNDYSNFWSDDITNPGSNYVNGDVVTVLGTSLGGTSPANDLTINLYKDQSSFYIDSRSGTAQSNTWKIETTAQVDFAGTGSWSITYSRQNECLLITPNWQRTFGTGLDSDDEIDAVAIDSEGNIIAVGDGYGELDTDSFQELAVVYKFNSTGTLQWARQLNTEDDDAYGDSVVTIGTDIYVVHEDDGSNAYVSKLDSTGTVKWQRRIEGDDITIARTPDGNLLVATEDEVNDVDDDVIKIFLLTPTGETVWKRWLSAITNDDTWLGSTGECLVTDTDSFYITGRIETEFNGEDNWAWAARLPLDGSGTGEYGQFRYTDVNSMTNDLSNDNYSINDVDIDDANNYAGALTNNSDPVFSTSTAVTVIANNINDYEVDGYYPPMVLEIVRDTDGGNIVFPDGTKQNTSATDIPQRLFNGVDYTLGMEDRGHHILCTDDIESIRIPYNSRVEFPIGTVITIVNPRGDSVVVSTEGGSIQVMIPGDDNYSNGGSFYVSEYGMATLLKIGTDSWVLAGNAAYD
jgi:hypothetical protein